MSDHRASFEITSARQFLEKLHEDQKDFAASHCLSGRHVLNAIITAYHLHEWIWGEWLEKCNNLRKEWGVDCAESFHEHLASKRCAALEDARRLTNGTKHFKNRIETGHHQGAFDAGAFSSDFDIGHLWIDRDGKKQRAEDFIDELVKFWDQFFAEHEII